MCLSAGFGKKVPGILHTDLLYISEGNQQQEFDNLNSCSGGTKVPQVPQFCGDKKRKVKKEQVLEEQIMDEKKNSNLTAKH